MAREAAALAIGGEFGGRSSLTAFRCNHVSSISLSCAFGSSSMSPAAQSAAPPPTEDERPSRSRSRDLDGWADNALESKPSPRKRDPPPPPGGRLSPSFDEGGEREGPVVELWARRGPSKSS